MSHPGGSPGVQLFCKSSILRVGVPGGLDVCKLLRGLPGNVAAYGIELPIFLK